MDIKIKNIGGINEAKLKLDGLTVITGLNNTGKTTVGRTVYSIFSAVEDLKKTYIKDAKTYVLSILSDMFDELEFLIRRFDLKDTSYKLEKNVELFIEKYKKTNEVIKNSTNKVEILDGIKSLKKLIEDTDDEILSSLHFSKNMFFRTDSHGEKENFNDMVDSKMKEMIKTIELDDELVEYANTKIMRQLNREFNNQVVNLNNVNSESMIKIISDDDLYFNINIIDKKIKEKSYYSSPINKTFFIDDIRVLDMIQEFNVNRITRRYRGFSSYTNSIGSVSITKDHNQKLVEHLANDEINIFDEIFNRKKAETVLNQINEILPNEILFDDGKLVYSKNKIDVRNLATGSKMFAILKMLIEKNLISQNTILILDEPESHLHPKWQNVLAEVIVLLSYTYNVKILLTTHSPNFLLAVDIYTKKYKIREKSNFYKALETEGGFKLQEITNNINEAYSHMARPFLEMENKLYDLENSNES